jgi:WD40 repeat protein
VTNHPQRVHKLLAFRMDYSEGICSGAHIFSCGDLVGIWCRMESGHVLVWDLRSTAKPLAAVQVDSDPCFAVECTRPHARISADKSNEDERETHTSRIHARDTQTREANGNGADPAVVDAEAASKSAVSGAACPSTLEHMQTAGEGVQRTHVSTGDMRGTLLVESRNSTSGDLGLHGAALGRAREDEAKQGHDSSKGDFLTSLAMADQQDKVTGVQHYGRLREDKVARGAVQQRGAVESMHQPGPQADSRCWQGRQCEGESDLELDGAARCCRPCPSGDRLVVIAGGGGVDVVWLHFEPASATLAQQGASKLAEPGVGDMCARRDGRIVAVGAWDGTTRLFHTRHRKQLAILKHHKQAVAAVTFSKGCGMLASGGRDGVVALWDVYRDVY